MTPPIGEQPVDRAAAEAPEAAASPGTQLRLAREAAQLTLDDVAQQLKLARRQVQALEDDDNDALPGPTFVRGFIRNYARLLRIDPEPLLPAGKPVVPATAPIQQLAPTMGELPMESGSGSSWSRWLIPGGFLLVLIAGIAYYEFDGVSLPGKKPRKEAAESVAGAPPLAPEPASQPAPGSGQTTAPKDGTTAESTPPPPPTLQPSPAGVTVPAVQALAPGSPVTPPAEPRAALPPVQAPVPAPTAMQAPAAAPSLQAKPQQASVEPGGGAYGQVDLELSGPSWIEVRDARGEILLSRTMSAKDRQTLKGKLPLSLRIGNASAVRLQFDGRPVDLGPHTRLEIARLTLPAPRP